MPALRIGTLPGMLRMLLPVLPAVLMAGCPPTQPGGDASGSGTAATDDAGRAAALQRISGTLASVEFDGAPETADAIASNLADDPDVARTAVLDTVVLVQFTDGETLVVVASGFGSNPPGGESDADALTSDIAKPKAPPRQLLASAAVRELRAQSTKLTRVPSAKTATLINTMGTAYKDSTGLLAGWFETAGYQPIRVEGTVEDFRSRMTDLGVLYMSGHGMLVPPDFLVQEKLCNAPTSLPGLRFFDRFREPRQEGGWR